MHHIPDLKVPITESSEGVLLVTGTRVSLHSVVGMFENGASAEEIAYEYDSLELSDVYAVISYYLRTREAVRAKLVTQEKRSDEAASRYEESFPQDLRAKLLQGKQRGG
jgi:uncharacterized protein (DUF433 family)